MNVADEPGTNGKSTSGGSTDTTGADLRALTAELKTGNVADLAKRLLRDNKKYRDRIRDLETQVAKLPSPESIVLSDAKEIERWNAVKDVPGEPADLKRMVKDYPAVKAAVDGYRKAEVHSRAAEAVGWKATGLLGRLIAADGLTVEMEEGRDADGKAVSVPVVKGEGDKSTPLTEYAETHWSDALPALTAEPNTEGRPATPARQPGTPPRSTHPRRPPPPARNPDQDAYEAARQSGAYIPM